jgi:serine protease
VDPAGLGAIDTTDAYRIVSHVGQDVTVVLTASTGGVAQGDFDVAVLETGTGIPLASASGAGNPHVVSFFLAGDDPADVVVTCASGWGAYPLSVETDDPVLPATVSTAGDEGEIAFEAVDYALVEPDCVPGRLVVRLAGGAASDLPFRVERATSGGSLVGSFVPERTTTAARETLARAARVAALPFVRFAEPDWIVSTQGGPPADPAIAHAWHLFGIGAPSAWETTTGDPSVVVGVVDSGVVASHPDLAGRMVGGYDFVTDPTTAADGGGRDPDPTDPGARENFDKTSGWHGTHIAGLVAARADDGTPAAGVAPGCRVMSLRAVGRGGGTVTDVADAIRYAAGLSGTAHGPPLPAPLRVVNLSLGTSQDSAELADACAAASAAGSLLIAAAGNSGGPLVFPAGYPEVLAVGATDARLVRAEFSSLGPELDLLAPGGDPRDRDGDGFPDGILSLGFDETFAPPRAGLSYQTGTSMAAAQVSGAAALLFSVDPSLDAAGARSLLLSTAKDRGVPGPDSAAGHGVLHAGDAVKAALAGLGTPRTGPPVLHLSTTSLRFRPNQSIWTVYAYDAGGGGLSLPDPVCVTDDGLPWLSAIRADSPTLGPADVPQIHVAIDPVLRAMLSPGAYAGVVRVTDGTTVLGSIRVVMEVGVNPPTGERLHVVAQEVSTGIVRASGFAHSWQGWRYVLKDLPAGEYTVMAGTDLDDDGFFCEAPDLCGRHGGFATPVEVVVPAGATVGGIDVRIE